MSNWFDGFQGTCHCRRPDEPPLQPPHLTLIGKNARRFSSIAGHSGACRFQVKNKYMTKKVSDTLLPSSLGWSSPYCLPRPCWIWRLPDYLARIVNTGVQLNGIETAVPEALTQNRLEQLVLFMNETDETAVREAYTLIQTGSTEANDYVEILPQSCSSNRSMSSTTSAGIKSIS